MLTYIYIYKKYTYDTRIATEREQKLEQQKQKKVGRWIQQNC